MIIDCFTFLNELEALEIRLHELEEVVDWFVLVEATETYKGVSKPLYFEAHQGDFARFNVCHIKLYGFPPELWTPWHREGHAREAIVKALAQLNLAPNDIILFSDADEIPRAESVRVAAEQLGSGAISCAVFAQNQYAYHLNRRQDGIWHGTRMTRYECLHDPAKPWDLAALRTRIGSPIPNGGWHFRGLGGSRRLKEKVRATLRSRKAEIASPTVDEVPYLVRCIRKSKDPFGRDLSLQTEPASNALPRHIIDNQTRFKKLLYAEPPDAKSSRDRIDGRRGATSLRPGTPPSNVSIQGTDGCPQTSVSVELPFTSRTTEQLKQELWRRWGQTAHPAEWDGNRYGGGKGSQRFWEYLWTIGNLPSPACSCVLDIGAGQTLFLPDLFGTRLPAVWAIDPDIPLHRRSVHYRAETLEEFLTSGADVGVKFDAVTCVSVLEHVGYTAEEKAEFCGLLDLIEAPIILTFELACDGPSGSTFVPLNTVYECLGLFRRHYVSRMELCPVWADDSAFGHWRPFGVLLLPCEEPFEEH